MCGLLSSGTFTIPNLWSQSIYGLVNTANPSPFLNCGYLSSLTMPLNTIAPQGLWTCFPSTCLAFPGPMCLVPSLLQVSVASPLYQRSILDLLDKQAPSASVFPRACLPSFASYHYHHQICDLVTYELIVCFTYWRTGPWDQGLLCLLLSPCCP